MLAEIVRRSRLARRAIAVMPLSNDDAALLVADDRIKLLTFTGSAAVGWQLKNRAGKKRVTLELGGNAGVIVHSDADCPMPSIAASPAAFPMRDRPAFRCSAFWFTRRYFRNSRICLLARCPQIQVRRPHAGKHRLPPLIREQDAVRVIEWIDEAVKAGARCCAAVSATAPS